VEDPEGGREGREELLARAEPARNAVADAGSAGKRLVGLLALEHLAARREPERPDRRAVADALVDACVRDHERLGRDDGVGAERVGEGRGARARPRLGEPDLALEEVPALVDQRDERHGDAEESCGEAGEAVEGLLGLGVEQTSEAQRSEAPRIAQDPLGIARLAAHAKKDRLPQLLDRGAAGTAPGRAYTRFVDPHALEVLELPAVVERLAAHAASEPGRALALALAPSGDPEEVARRARLTEEGVLLLERGIAPDLAGAADVREEAAHAARAGALDPGALWRVAATARRALEVRRMLADAEDAPLLAGVAAAVDARLGALADAIERVVEEGGSALRDDASPRLRALRRELREGRLRLAEELRRLARGGSLREHLQEDFVTERGGRPVLAVKASARNKIPGIVHDVSASGQTVFVEPFTVVEAGNRLREVAGAEREEQERILVALSAAVGASADALEAAVEAIGAVDLTLACATLSRRWGGVAVERSDEIRLRAACHPLLDPATAVPIDLELGHLRVLVVSGPNTGGKTVALKTLGLAALLHQCGLRPPAEHAALPVFDRVLADIGDEQSIAMSLSTFSGHLRNLVAILDAATERSLVLLDELAAGTDPVEGAALAQALLERLSRQARLTVVTSHFAELKEWASAAPAAANAATAIDPVTHVPLYRLALGRPGASHALRTAERLGLAADVVAAARARIAPERRRIEQLLAEAEAAERAAEAARAEADAERAAAARAREQVEARGRELVAELDRVRASAQRERDRARAEAERELAEARADLARLRDEIRAARRKELERRRAAAAGVRPAERERDRRLGAASERAVRAERSLAAAARPVPATAPLAPGDPVTAPSVGVRGTIAELDGDEALVLGPGGLKVRVALSALQPDPRGGPAAAAEPPVRVRTSIPANVPSELDVRGQRAQEAREAVRAYVDDAALAGRSEVLVVHGRGTGAVRAAVREELARHPLVAAVEPESADGASRVRLAGR
jgi:DNA mismatch repair protein MutS2